MRILFLFVTVMLVAGSAAANLCSPAWLANASGAEARALIRSGFDVNGQCNTNGNEALHLALLNDRVDPDVIQALVDAGADLYAQNIHGETPSYYAIERFQRARAHLGPGSAAYRRERAIYESMFEGGDARDAPAAAAHEQLCDLNWWRSSASGPAVQQLLSVPGVDKDHVCNFNNDRIIHQPLKRASFVMLTVDIHLGIRALVDAGASLTARNNSGDSALSLAKIRYDRVLDRSHSHQITWCRGGAQLEGMTRNGPDRGVYYYIASSGVDHIYEEVRKRLFMEEYHTQFRLGVTVKKAVLCPAIGIHDYR